MHASELTELAPLIQSVSLLTLGPDVISSAECDSSRLVNVALETIDMLLQSSVLVLQKFSLVLEIQNYILLVRVELMVSSFSPACESLLNLPVVHADN